LKAGYKFDPFVSHEKIIENNKADYYKALNIAQETWKTDHEDITPWLFFFLKVVRKQAETAVKLIEMDEVEAWLSDRQKAVRKCVLKNDGVSRKEIIDETGSPAPTVNQALQKLLDMKKIIRK
jgi:Fic family protein